MLNSRAKHSMSPLKVQMTALKRDVGGPFTMKHDHINTSQMLSKMSAASFQGGPVKGCPTEVLDRMPLNDTTMWLSCHTQDLTWVSPARRSSLYGAPEMLHTCRQAGRCRFRRQAKICDTGVVLTFLKWLVAVRISRAGLLVLTQARHPEMPHLGVPLKGP